MSAVKNEMVPIQVRVPRPLRTRFKLVAAKQDRSAATILREFIEWYVEKEEKTSERV